MQGKEFEKLKSSKAPAAWVPWLWLTGAIFWAACLIIHNIFDDNGRAALHAACFVGFTVVYFASQQSRVNRALAEEIQRLKEKIELE
ncbi:MAG: hypothetical protein IT364_22080 [Candidatus Hydrogenedentes bacterium]|nr:hypothetical protein [Candidatus Hydrogenedentota bacterium]